jgi:hypothetical protein
LDHLLEASSGCPDIPLEKKQKMKWQRKEEFRRLYHFLLKLVGAKDGKAVVSFICGETFLCTSQLRKHLLDRDVFLFPVPN